MSGSTITRLLTTWGLTAIAATLLSGCAVKKTFNYGPPPTELEACGPGIESDMYASRAQFTNTNEVFVSDQVFRAYLTIMGEDITEGVPDGTYISRADAIRMNGKRTDFIDYLASECDCYAPMGYANWFATEGNIILPASTVQDFDHFQRALRAQRLMKELDDVDLDQYNVLMDAYESLAAQYSTEMTEHGFSTDDFRVFLRELIDYVGSSEFDPNGPKIQGLIGALNEHDLRAGFLVECIVGNIEVTYEQDRHMDTMLP